MQEIDTSHLVRSLSDEELLRRTAELLQDARHAEADLLAHIGEIEARRLYARFAVSSMFGYCTRVLHLSEHEAYLRITAARSARKHPPLLAMLAEGRLHLTGIARLSAHLTSENLDDVLARATHRSMREVEELIAGLSPAPDAPALIRKLPERHRAADCLLSSAAGAPPAGPPATVAPEALSPVTPGESAADELVLKRVAPTVSTIGSPSPPATIRPTSPARYKVQFTASAALRDKLERLRALVRSSVPDGDLAAVIEIAVTQTLARLEARRFGAAQAREPGAPGAQARRRAADKSSAPASPSPARGRDATPPSSRYVPADVRRAVCERDGGRCRYVDERRQRCEATSRLEFHHRYPFGHGGAHTTENVCLMCHTHNGYLAEVDYGREPVGRSRMGRMRSTRAPAEASAG